MADLLVSNVKEGEAVTCASLDTLYCQFQVTGIEIFSVR